MHQVVLVVQQNPGDAQGVDEHLVVAAVANEALDLRLLDRHVVGALCVPRLESCFALERFGKLLLEGRTLGRLLAVRELTAQGSLALA